MLISIIMMLILLFFPQASVEGALSGLRLCANSVIPSLFPFFVAARLLPAFKCRRLAKFLKLSEPTVSALAVSFLGGYPIGVARLCAMYEDGSIEKHEAQQAIVYCNNSGPGFFIGMIGSIVLHNVKLGVILYVIHVLSAIFCVYIFKSPEKPYIIRRTPEPVGFAQRFTNAVSASCEGMLNVCALVVLFSCLMSVINQIPISLPYEVRALLFGSLELTSGISMCADSFVLCSFLMGWGGLCVHLQAMSLWKKQGLNVKNYFSSKLLHGVISAAFARAYLHSAVFFGAVILLFIAIYGVMRNYIKIGVEKKENMLYNTFER